MKTADITSGEYPLQISWRTFAYKNRKLHMTKEGIFFSFIILGVGMAAINTGINLLYLIFAMTCSFMVLAGVLSEYCLSKMSADIYCPHQVFADESFPLTVTLHNGKRWFPSFSLRVVLEVLDLSKNDEFYLHRVSPNSSVKKTVLMKLEQRGRFSLEQPELSTRFPFNFGVKSRRLCSNISFLIFPKLLQEEKVYELLKTSFGGERKQQRRSEQGEFAGNRQFLSGDSIKYINWKASAKGDTIYVKEFEVSEVKKLSIFFHNSQISSPDIFEEKVSLVASLIYYSGGWGYKVNLATPEKSFSSIDSKEKEYEALAYLAEIQQTPSEKTSMPPFSTHEPYIYI